MLKSASREETSHAELQRKNSSGRGQSSAVRGTERRFLGLDFGGYGVVLRLEEGRGQRHALQGSAEGVLVR